MKVLLYWHDAALPSSAYLLEALDRAPQVTDVLILAPRRSGAPAIFTAPRDDAPLYHHSRMITVSSYQVREDWCRFTEWFQHVKAFKPDLLLVLEEAFSVNVLLAAIANRLLNPGARVLFYGFENIKINCGLAAFRKNPGRTTLFALLRKTARYVAFDLVALPVRKALVHGGLVSYPECAAVIRSMGWDAQMVEHWWGINTAAFRRDGIAADTGLPPNLFRLGYVGRFAPAKGLFGLIEAVHDLGPEYGLVLVGDGEDKAALEEQIARLGIGDRVCIKPPCNHARLAELYRGMDLLVLPSLTTPSWKEQFGRVLIEAMHCGTPTVGSDSGAIPYVIADPRRIFPEGNITAMAECVRRIRSEGRSDSFAQQLRNTSAEDFIQAFIRLGNTPVRRESPPLPQAG